MNQNASPYRRGADNGFLFGIYLIALFFAMIGAEYHGILGLLTMTMALAVPFMIYRFLRRSYTADHGTTPFSSLWMQGIMTFLCGSLISGVAAFVFMRWLDPAFMTRNAERAIEIYRTMDNPSATTIADGLEVLLRNGALPTPIQIVFQSIWGAVLSGSLLSLIVSAIVRSQKPGKEISGGDADRSGHPGTKQ